MMSVLYNNYFKYIFQILLTFSILLFRNNVLIDIIDTSTNHKLLIHRLTYISEKEFNEFDLNVITSTIVETITFIIGMSYISKETHILYDLLLFIPVSFIFEIIFDFFHYWSHRIIHSNKYLYYYIHKKHHKYIHPITILTFYQDPIDLTLTNSIPLFLTLFILSYMYLNISMFTFNMIIVYKSYIEISGHSGKQLYPSGSFPQFIWLPKLLNIQLYSETHDYHHTHTNYNYSKRFTLWDKVFNTFREN